MSKPTSMPSITIDYGATGTSMLSNELGMRPMQERAYEKRGEQYLLIKSPPASGKSRALMFVALDKLHNQDIRQAIIVVPEKSIGASFASESLAENGFYWDWEVRPQWNLCNAPGTDGGKVASVAKFLASEDRVLVCTHATFRFALDKIGIEAFDNRLVAIDEFHHVSTNDDNKLGVHLSSLMARDKTHIVAMTGSYFRGDAEAVLTSDDEAKFESVTYTYYEQLNGYRYLKHLDIGYYFYSDEYSSEILSVIKPTEKTIIHIPSVNSRESTKDKIKEVNHIINELGEWLGVDDRTGFHLVKTGSGATLRIADLVDPQTQSRTQESLRSPKMKTERDYVDIIIALGMAKEGFDWIWCEHALTVGYRSSLTEIIQIIGRATRDAEGKVRARFTNLIAEPDADQDSVVDAVNDTIKAIAASLLMEQVLAPRFNFRAKNPSNEPIEGYDYGGGGYDPSDINIGYDQHRGQFDIQINGLKEPISKEANRICQEDLNEVIASFIQDKTTMEKGMFDEALIPEEITQVRMGKIVRDKYPNLDEEDLEAVRQHAIAAMNIAQQAKKMLNSDNTENRNTALIDGVRKFAMDVRELDIDLIDRINPFSEAYSVMSKAMNEKSLREIASIITGKKINLTAEEARELARRALKFKNEHGRLPSQTSTDPWEARMAEGVNFLARLKAESMNE